MCTEGEVEECRGRAERHRMEQERDAALTVVKGQSIEIERLREALKDCLRRMETIWLPLSGDAFAIAQARAALSPTPPEKETADE
jgi:hypothetical protein